MLVVTELLQAISVILACWAAIAAIDAWKREHIGKRQIDLAEQVLAKFFEIRDAISMIRSPISYSGEGSKREREEYEMEEDSKLLDRVYLIHERFEKKREVFNEFNVLKYKFLASFGKEHEAIFTDVVGTVNMIFSSAQILGTYYWKRQGRVKMSKEEFSKHLEEMQRHEGIYWEGFTEKDEIKERLMGILSRIEAVTRPCFDPPSTLYSRMTKRLWFHTKSNQ